MAGNGWDRQGIPRESKRGRREVKVTVTYVARNGSGLTDSDAQALGTRLMELAEDGVLSPERVVADARQPDSPTHRYFEWDDLAAAHKYRLHQADTYITSIRFVPASGAEPKPIAIRMSQGDRYATVATAMQPSDVLLQLIDRVQSELERLQDRYRTYPTLQPVLEGPIEEAVLELTRLAMALDIEYPEDEDLPRVGARD
mgnify:CR=1 FL=1